jgi:dTDP-4-dehydrorhamnose reductase
MMKIAIIGADGQLGSDLARTLREDEVVPLYYPDFDITQAQRTREVLRRLNPEAVINTAAYHRVDECEDNPQTSFLVNAVAVRDLALTARELGVILVHFSTDYVFDGQKKRPYIEEDRPFPLSVYAASKLAGEFFVRALVERYFLVRTCGLYGEASSREKGYNFVDRMIAWAEEGKLLRIVNDQWVTPTSSAELAEKISELIRTPHFGLFHLTNEGECTWYQFAQEIFSLLGRKPRLEGVDSRSFGARARRPLYSVLENKKAKDIGLSPLSPWRVALKSYLKKKGYLT